MVSLAGLPSDAELADWLHLLLPEGERGVVALLTAAIDESGTHKDSPIICVAACVALPHEWRRFRKAWRPHVANLPKPYHATKHKKNPAGLNERLAGLIEQHVEVCLAVTVSYGDYMAATTPRFRSLWGSAYSVGAIHCMGMIRAWSLLRRIKFRNVAYVFERGHPNSGHVEKLFGKILADSKGRSHFRIHSQAWLDKSELILHAPDLVSFEVAASHAGELTPIARRLAPMLMIEHLGREGIERILELVK